MDVSVVLAQQSTQVKHAQKTRPNLTIQMGHFVRAEVAKALPFDEDMNTGEDWDYYLRLWRDHGCVKISAPLMINDRSRHSTGPRAASGRDWNKAVGEMISNARA